MNSRNKVQYKDLYELATVPCICALENTKNKKVLLFASDNPLLYVSNLINRLTTKKHGNQELYKSRKKLKLRILETGVSDKWSVLFWYNDYSRNGWSFFSSYKPVSLNVHIKIDYRYGVLVELCNKGGKGFVVGVFNTMSEAEAWIDYSFPDLDYINPVFASNLETINYYRNNND